MMDACVEAVATGTYIATGEITTLKHKVGDHAVELGASITEALLAGGQSAEVFDSLGNDIVKEFKVDAS